MGGDPISSVVGVNLYVLYARVGSCEELREPPAGELEGKSQA